MASYTYYNPIIANTIKSIDGNNICFSIWTCCFCHYYYYF